MTSSSPDAPQQGSKAEMVCHVGALNPSWSAARIGAATGVSRSFVFQVLKTFGRRAIAARRSFSAELSPVEIENLNDAAVKRSIGFDDICARMIKTCAADPTLIDNVLDDEVAS